MKKLLILLVFLSVLLMIPKEVYALEQIPGPNVIYKEKTKILTINDILKVYEIENYTLSVVEDKFTGKGNVMGSYPVIIQATNGVETLTKTIQVRVIESLPLITILGDLNIYVRPDVVLTATDIRTALRNSGQITIPLGSAFEIVSDTYTGNESTNGVYTYDFRILSPSGTIQSIEAKIYVSEELSNFVVIDTPKSSNNFGSKFTELLSNILLFGFIGVVGFFVIKVVTKAKRFGGR